MYYQCISISLWLYNLLERAEDYIIKECVYANPYKIPMLLRTKKYLLRIIACYTCCNVAQYKTIF